jgi:Trk K+ transport system NAD-binding subunit
VVCGDNALARRLVVELMDRYFGRVTVIVRSATANQAPEIAELQPQNGDPALQPTILVAPRLTQEVFRLAGIDDADALALVDQDDVANVDAALIAREVSSTVRIVLRMFNPILGEGITTMLGNCGVLSGSEIAAPAFVAAARGVGTPTYIRMADDVLMVARRAHLDDPDNVNDVLCGLAITQGATDPVTLPADEDAADVLLVRAYGPPAHRRPRRHRHPLRLTRLLFGRNQRIIVGALLAVLAAGTVSLAWLRHIDVWQAVYATVLTALGSAELDTGKSGLEQAIQILLVVVGVALVPVLTAAVVGAVINARLAMQAGGLVERVSDHVIVAGLGNVGTRVIRELHDFGITVVAIDRSDRARGVQAAREMGIPVIIGPANSSEILRCASVETARTLVVLATDDVTNLETALLARAIHRRYQETARPRLGTDPAAPPRKLRVVLRLFDEDFAGRVKRAFDIDSSRSVSYLAAPAFAAAMMGREVIDTISVGRRILVVAELPVGAGSELEGKFCPEVNRPHQVRLIAVRTGRGGQTLWTLPERRPLARTDRLLVVATRAGLADLLARTAGVPDPPPLIELEPLRLLTIQRRPGERPTPA